MAVPVACNMAEQKQMWLDGEWCDAASGEVSEIFDPSDSSVMCTVPRAGAIDVERAVSASRTALQSKDWSLMDPAQRGRILQKMAAATYAAAKQLAALESQNNGKTFREALGEIRYAAWTLEYFAGWADKVEGNTIPTPGNRLNYTLRQPLGVTAHIVPWNFPLQLAIRSIAPALAAGCTAIVKPASLTPVSLLEWCNVIQECGLPSGVLQVITGPGGEIGDALAGSSGVDGIVLTGGVPTGKAVMKKAAENLIPVALELGGKGCNVVFADANLKYCAKAVCFGIYMNAGQMCWAGSRLLVHEDVVDELLNLISDEVGKWKVGPGMAEGVRIGSMVSKDHRQSVLDMLQQGLEQGGELILGGNALDGELEGGAFMEPTIVKGVGVDDLLFKEELFGPVLAVSTFSDEKEALQMANATEFGLLNGIWTQNLGLAHRMARDIQSGMISINEYPITFPQTPFTGWKSSGIGVEQSAEAMKFYTRLKNVNVNLG
jgi:aldehyde dehydrogenase (NAD+)